MSLQSVQLYQNIPPFIVVKLNFCTCVPIGFWKELRNNQLRIFSKMKISDKNFTPVWLYENCQILHNYINTCIIDSIHLILIVQDLPMELASFSFSTPKVPFLYPGFRLTNQKTIFCCP